jgi:putative transport protein
MEIDFYELISGNRTLLLFLVIGLGYLVGNIKIGGIEVGSTTGVLLAGLLCGHLGFPGVPDAATFGFTLFIFCVGLQAGPRFFSVFLEDGSKYIALSAFLAAIAVCLAILIGKLLGLGFGMNAGLLAGALTSTPTLAGAEDAIRSGLATLPSGMAAEEASRNISVAYALTYIFGTVGLIVFIRYLPIILRIDLPEEAQRLAQERGLSEGKPDYRAKGEDVPAIRAYRVTDDRLLGTPLGELSRSTGQDFAVLRLRRGDRILDPSPDLQLENGDVFSAISSLRVHRKAQETVGQEVLDPELLNYQIVSREIVVMNPAVIGKPLGELNLPTEHGCFPTAVVRSSISLPVDDNVVMTRGDLIAVTGEEARLQQLAEKLGHIEEDIQETDLLTFAFGIAAGILAGMFLVKLGNLSIGLGSAGGLLLFGILIGFLRNLHPTFGRVPAAARHILMELGLMMFMASVGLKAGGGIVEAFLAVGPVLMLCGVAVTLIPVIAGYAFGRLVLKMNPALLLGALTGSMTSTPSLNVVTEAARSSLPALGYAGTYTFANVFLTFAGTLLMTL